MHDMIELIADRERASDYMSLNDLAYEVYMSWAKVKLKEGAVRTIQSAILNWWATRTEKRILVIRRRFRILRDTGCLGPFQNDWYSPQREIAKHRRFARRYLRYLKQEKEKSSIKKLVYVFDDPLGTWADEKRMHLGTRINENIIQDETDLDDSDGNVQVMDLFIRITDEISRCGETTTEKQEIQNR